MFYMYSKMSKILLYNTKNLWEICVYFDQFAKQSIYGTNV